MNTLRMSSLGQGHFKRHGVCVTMAVRGNAERENRAASVLDGCCLQQWNRNHWVQETVCLPLGM